MCFTFIALPAFVERCRFPCQGGSAFVSSVLSLVAWQITTNAVCRVEHIVFPFFLLANTRQCIACSLIWQKPMLVLVLVLEECSSSARHASHPKTPLTPDLARSCPALRISICRPTYGRCALRVSLMQVAPRLQRRGVGRLLPYLCGHPTP